VIPTRLILFLLAGMYITLPCGLLAAYADATRTTFRGDPDYLIDRWDFAQAWPDSPPRSIAQTSDGYLWCGTLHGLLRFDGVRYTLFDKATVPELPNSGITRLHVAREGDLWVGTVNGLAVRHGAEWRPIPLPGTNDNRGHYIIRSLAERRNGDLLVTTADRGMLEFSEGRFQALPTPFAEPTNHWFSRADAEGNWWVVAPTFLAKWDGRAWAKVATLVGLTNFAPRRVGGTAGRTSGLWLVLGAELRHYEGEAETRRTPLPGLGGEILDVLEDRRGNVWICAGESGLWQVNPDQQVRHWSTANGLPDTYVWCAFEDRDQNVWVGAETGGLTRFRERAFHSFFTSTNRAAFARYALSPSTNGDVFIAAWRQGVWRATAGQVAKLALPKPFEDGSVSALSLLADRSGGLWVGAMTDGVWRVEGPNVRRLAIDQSGQAPVNRLFEDSRGRVWLAGGRSVAVFEAGRMRSVAPSEGLPPGSVNAFAEDHTGAIWLAQERGVFRLETNRWAEVLDAEGRSLHVSGLFPDSGGTLWMASINAGLFCWRDGRLQEKRLPPQLPMRGVYGFIEDNLGSFWMISNQGILCALKQDLTAWFAGTPAEVAWQRFDAGDGLPAAECGASARDGRGRLWFATVRGVAWVDPKAGHPDPIPPTVQIEDLTYYRAARRVYGGEPAGAPAPPVRVSLQSPFPARLTLAPGSRRLELDYTAFDFSAPEKLRFQVKLEPNDSDWNDVGERRTAYYYDFNPGQFVFHVRAVNHQGLWNEAGASLAFTVQPFFWQTWWFRGGALAFLLAAGGSVAWWGAHRRHQNEIAQWKRTQQQQAELAHVGRVAVMGELASSLAHELNQPLGAILRNAEAAELFLEAPSPDLAEVRAILEDIRADDQRAGAVVDRMRAMMKRRPIEFALVDVNELAANVLSLVRSDADTRKVRITFEAAPAVPLVKGDRVQLQQVLLNLLVNAMEAVTDSAPPARQVAVCVQAAGTQILVAVRDAGRGIPADQLTRIFEPFFTTKPNGLGMGLAICSRILEAHAGRLWAENNPDRGATFRFTLPAAKPQPGPA